MAVDTRNKRFSILGLFQPVPSIFPNPDGVIGIQDRAQFLFLYAGLALAVPSAVLSFGVYGLISNHGQSNVGEISAFGQSVTGEITSTHGMLGHISGNGKGVAGEISSTGISIKGDI